MIDSHPALVAASPQAPMTDLFLGDDGYHGGAFMLSANFGFYAPFFHPQKDPQTPKPTVPFDFGTPDSYQFYLKAGNICQPGQALSEGLELAVQRPGQARRPTTLTGRRGICRGT